VSSEAAALVRSHVERRAPLERELHEAEWQLNLTSEEKWETESVRLGTEIRTLLSDRDAFARVRAARGNAGNDTRLARELERLYLEQAGNQTDPALLREIVQREARIETLFGRFRPVVNGKPLTENAIRQTLRDSGDEELRRRTWEASKEIGKEAAPLVREMARLRNRAAREAGWDGYHAMALELQEIEPAFLFDLLERLEDLTAEPYDRMIGELFDSLGARFGTDRADIRPWHLADPFFQEAVAPADLRLAPFYEEHDLVQLTRDAFTAMGFDIARTLERSDLFPRDGKNQHAFCTHVDRLTDDVRVLCNVVPDDNWMDTMMHEFGHAVYDLGIDPHAPWLLRHAAHILSTEAIALLFGRLATNPDWMIRRLGARAADVDPLRERLAAYSRFKQLLFPRWVMVMVHFERALYADPDQDLDTLWWDLVERFQKVPRPDGAREGDWAAKIHIGLAPVYYQNYLLGDLMASQLDDFLGRTLGTPFWWEHAGTAELLRTRLFHDGALYPWNESLRRATGAVLDPAHYVEQYVTAAR
jgi:peptidyl-dipeptidase A